MCKFVIEKLFFYLNIMNFFKIKVILVDGIVVVKDDIEVNNDMGEIVWDKKKYFVIVRKVLLYF